MHMNKVTGLLVLLCCELCLTIKVPTIWKESGNSAVKNDNSNQVEINRSHNVQSLQQSQSIPVEYFQYTAHKPKFATDIAAFHGVKHPQQNYKAYPINPYTAQRKPVLGIHHMLQEDRKIYRPYQNYIQRLEGNNNYVQPKSTGYEIFHPYKAEEPSLQEIYKDPILGKIRNDLENSKNRLQAYEQDAGKPNITDDEYLESIEKTDDKLFPQKNVPAPYEIHRTERRPVYYRVPPQNNHRDHILNQKFKHPWNQHNIKIKPLHYKPLKNHIQHLRQQHAMKYDDEQNEYPQVHLYENLSEPMEGYDIYEKGKEKYTQLRNNVDESINKAVQENRPIVYQKLELQPIDSQPKDEDEEFVPVKNYAQVRKTETTKHVPRKAAFDDAENYEEIINAPRLREAIKSTKAQIVYSEEGYEDSAYDHAGEQKHASDHEGHGGILKETVKSGGLYKIPTVLGSYQDGRGSEYRDNIEHGKKWINNDEDNEEETNAEDYSENEQNESNEADIYDEKKSGKATRNKRDGIKQENMSDGEAQVNVITKYDTKNNSLVANEMKNNTEDHELDKREVNFEIPTINLNTTYLTEDEILKIAKQKLLPNNDYIKDKYPYYFKKFKSIHKNSPLRYAENMKFIPKKSNGGTEFYDSRSILECPEIDADLDPIPENLKNGENPTEKDPEDDDKANDKDVKKISKLKGTRLDGLGDKIDCFKAKYFGENPLDSPFFKEEIISNPEPITVPTLSIYEQLRNANKKNAQNSKINKISDLSQDLKEGSNTDIFVLLDKLKINHTPVQKSLDKLNISSDIKSYTPQNILASNNTQQSNIYKDVLTTIKNNLQYPFGYIRAPVTLLNSNNDTSNISYNFFQNKEEVTKLPPNLRKKRATPFIYEPYKIIRDSQYQDSKKTTTTSNISPLIRQLQTSRVVDRVSKPHHDDNKSNIDSRIYVDIGKNDRTNINPTIVDISVDHRRGEPRYEIKPINHKSEYTPVENKRSMSMEDYKTRTTTEKTDEPAKNSPASWTSTRGRQRFRHSTAAVRPGHDNTQKVSASNTIRKTVSTTTKSPVSAEIKQIQEDPNDESKESDEDYDDDDEEEESEEDITTTTSTTTPKPAFRLKIKVSTTTEKAYKHSNEAQPERLKLVTRFRNYKPDEKQLEIGHVTDPSVIKKYKEEDHTNIPKFREKKKKTSESTLMTDTKKYGDQNDNDEDDTEEEEKEIDALIGVKHDIDDYMPLYEKEEHDKRGNLNEHTRETLEEDDEDNIHGEIDDSSSDDDDDDEDDIDDHDDEDDDEEEESQSETKVTTPESTKRSLLKTTEAPPPTVPSHMKATFTASRDLPSENKPVITRKKIEIHKELPVNKSSPHITKFKQDIKELEIIKEMPAPKRKSQKPGTLEFYKDDNLAKDINKLEDVEVFGEDIDLDKGPKHGGNLRKANKEDLKLLTLQAQDSSTVVPIKDVEASQSENRRRVELDQYAPTNVQRLHGGNLKSLSDFKRTRNSGRNAKLIEHSNTPKSRMHGGNLKIQNKGRGGGRSEKLTELDDDRHDDDSSYDDDYKSLPHNSRDDRLHGGNYRSAKLVAEKVKNPEREARRSATVLLNNFVQAVPVLTTTPGYIVDPSKRMYYYVDV